MRIACLAFAVSSLLPVVLCAEEALTEQELSDAKVKLLKSIVELVTPSADGLRVAPEEVAVFYGRLSKAMVEQAATPEAQLAAAEENLKRIEKFYDAMAGMFENQRVLKFSLDQVDICRAEARQQVAQLKKDAAGERAQLEAKIKILEPLEAVFRSFFETGRMLGSRSTESPIGALLAVQKRLYEARRDLAATPEARAELAKKHLESIGKVDIQIKDLVSLQRATTADMVRSEFARIEAQQEVARWTSNAAMDRELAKNKVKLAERHAKEGEKLLEKIPLIEVADRMKRYFDAAIEATEPNARLALAEEQLKTFQSYMKVFESLPVQGRASQLSVDLFKLEVIEAQLQVARLKRK